MTPKSRLQKKNQKAAQSCPQPIDVDPVRVAFSVLIEGVQLEKTLAWNDIPCRNHEGLCDAVKVISQETIELAQLSMDPERKKPS